MAVWLAVAIGLQAFGVNNEPPRRRTNVIDICVSMLAATEHL
jgi:hypothetical protein